MKYVFNVLMMLMGYTGFSQSANTGKAINNTITFPNGDEAITIIENSESNVLKLTTGDNYDSYEMLELSNHEVYHNLSNKRRIEPMDSTVSKQGRYTVKNSEKDPEDSKEDSFLEQNQDS